MGMKEKPNKKERKKVQITLKMQIVGKCRAWGSVVVRALRY
jgi:hypothetical protein